MSKIISVFGSQVGEGRTTIATSMAKILGQTDLSVLYVELDAVNPNFAFTTGLSNDTSNTLNFMLKIKEDGKVIPNEFIQNEHQGKQFPKNVHFLTFPMGYELKQFPYLLNENLNEVLNNIPIKEFIVSFVGHFKRLEYDVILFSLPHDVGDLFGLPIMIESDYILNVVTTNQRAIAQNKKNFELLKDVTDLNIKEKWRVVVNKYVDEIPRNQLETYFEGQKVVATISNDDQQIVNDLTGGVGTANIDYDVAYLLYELQFPINLPKRKGLFGGMKR